MTQSVLAFPFIFMSYIPFLHDSFSLSKQTCEHNQEGAGLTLTLHLRSEGQVQQRTIPDSGVKYKLLYVWRQNDPRSTPLHVSLCCESEWIERSDRYVVVLWLWLTVIRLDGLSQSLESLGVLDRLPTSSFNLLAVVLVNLHIPAT